MLIYSYYLDYNWGNYSKCFVRFQKGRDCRKKKPQNTLYTKVGES